MDNPRPVPFFSSLPLVVKNGSKDILQDLRGNPARCRRLPHDRLVVSAGGDMDLAVAADRVDGVVDHIEKNLLQLAMVTR